jgi:hypothetical protein
MADLDSAELEFPCIRATIMNSVAVGIWFLGSSINWGRLESINIIGT